MNHQNNIFDVAVIGGGAAGMMAAGTAGESGGKVVLLEKNDRLGKKLLITGKGRCNITNSNLDVKSFCDNFGKNGKFLYQALFDYNVESVINFFQHYEVKCKIERGHRVFPESDKALDVLNVLIKYLKETKVDIKLNSAVKDIIASNNKIIKLILDNDQQIFAKTFILCTGGKSYPTTGSNGDGYKWCKDLGHSIIPVNPALVSVIINDRCVKQLHGLSLKNVQLNIYQNNKKIDSRFGEALFTHNGLSGPIVLDLSKKIRELLLTDQVKVVIDFKPTLDYKTLDVRILRDFNDMNNKEFKNSLLNLLPKKLIPVIIEKSGIDPTKVVNSIRKDERKRLLHLLKEFQLTIVGVDGFNKAIVTSGGVSLNEIYANTMESKIIDNLYFAGEIIDLDGPTGGYNLQLAWSTGHLAGKSCLQKLIKEKGED